MANTSHYEGPVTGFINTNLIAAMRDGYVGTLNLEDVRRQYKKAIQAVHQGEVELHRYNAMLAELARDLLVPPGHGVDVHGDGTVKPAQDCKKHP